MPKLPAKLLLLLAFFSCHSVFASRLDMLKPLKNYEDLEFYLLTTNAGAGIHARYGHTLLGMKMRSPRREYNLNWGLFDFSDPMFAINFYRGFLKYRVDTESTGYLIKFYTRYDVRGLFRERIVFTAAQKKRLYEAVLEATTPEKRVFDYHFFFKNCATIPRDLIDVALQGKLSKWAKSKNTELKFRDYVRSQMNLPAVVGFSLDIFMNETIDGPLTYWDEMFYPIKVREYMSQLPAFDDKGQPIPGSRLLVETQTLVNKPDVRSSQKSLYHYFFAMGLALFALSVILIFVFNKAVLGHRFFGLLVVLWNLFSGSFGLVMLLSWIISEHREVQNNLNLLLLWPIDFLLIPVGIQLLRYGKLELAKVKRSSFLLGFIQVHCLLAVIYGLGWMAGVFSQNISFPLLYLGPVAILVWLGISYLIREAARKDNKAGCH